MAKKDDNLGRTVATAELVETIKNKLGITSPIEEFVESYNRTLPSRFPIFLMNIAPLWQSEDRSKYPECARKVFFPWRDILACIVVKHHHLALSERTCPDCGERMVLFYYTSPTWTCNSLCGRSGFLTICPSCPKQVDFVLTMMN